MTSYVVTCGNYDVILIKRKQVPPPHPFTSSFLLFYFPSFPLFLFQGHFPSIHAGMDSPERRKLPAPIDVLPWHILGRNILEKFDIFDNSQCLNCEKLAGG